MKRVLLAVTAVSFPVACQMPASVLLFWCTNNVFSMGYTGVLKTAAVKAALGIAQMPTKESTKVMSSPPSRPQTPPAPPPPTPTRPHPPPPAPTRPHPHPPTPTHPPKPPPSTPNRLHLLYPPLPRLLTPPPPPLSPPPRISPL